MNLYELKIERQNWGPEKGQFKAVITLDDDRSKITLTLSAAATLRLMAVAKQELIIATHDAAVELETKIQHTIPTLQDSSSPS
jgi:hypothetical protein